MNTRYTVQWSIAAENDLIGIIEYIARDNITNAKNIFGRIKEKVSDLNVFPERGRIVPELADHGITIYREIIVPPWRVVYRISDKKVYVLSVFDSRQNIEDILLKRLIKEIKIC
ncbi:MAG: type II toxin-antitoxin system RelE/ParE family toxin [Desulfobacteraceae bacterium]|jgi:plasmid stabilization system protein ParE|nr:MAG: type II toxin-antitoxin system RelE/ParE family toxin [Desulfobacteraceae bacterium]